MTDITTGGCACGLRTTLALFGDQAGDYHNLDTTIETLAGDRDLAVFDD